MIVSISPIEGIDEEYKVYISVIFNTDVCPVSPIMGPGLSNM